MIHYRKFVLFIIFIMYATVFGTRISIGVALPALISEFGMTNTEAGALSGFFFLGYFLTQVPAGFWISRFGSRGLVGISLFLMSLFLWLFGSMASLTWAVWYRFGLGISQGPASVGGNATIGQWFPVREQSRAISVMLSSAMLSPILFPPVCTWFIVEWGWRLLFQSFAIIGVVITALWYIYIRSYPEESRHCSAEELALIRRPEALQPIAGSSALPPLLFRFLNRDRVVPVAVTKTELLKRPDIWWTTLSYFFSVSLFYGIITWMPSYFINVRGMDMIEMGWIVAVPWVGGFFGALAGGWVVDHWLGGNPLALMSWGSLFTALSLAMFAMAPPTMGWTIVLLVLFGFFLGFTPAGFMTYPIRLATRKVYPVSMAIMNSGGNVGGFLSSLVAGMILDRFESFSMVFAYFVACGLLAAVVSLMARRPVASE